MLQFTQKKGGVLTGSKWTQKLRVWIGLDVKADRINKNHTISDFTHRMGLYRDEFTKERYDGLFSVFVESWVCCSSDLDRLLAYRKLKDVLAHWPTEYRGFPGCFYDLSDVDLMYKIVSLVLHDDAFGTLKLISSNSQVKT